MKKNRNQAQVLENAKILEFSKGSLELSLNNTIRLENFTQTVMKMLYLKDPYTHGHSMRVAYFSTKLAEEIGLNEKEIKTFQLAAMFHDLGKIGIMDSVLLKPSRLEEDEFNHMKNHPVFTEEILKNCPECKELGKWARHHHERYDGRGYPDKLKGDEIPLASRIILIADTFDAMTSTRPYRKGLPYETAYQELRDFSGEQFDPTLVEAFIKVMTEEQKKKEDKFYIEILKTHFDKKAA